MFGCSGEESTSTLVTDCRSEIARGAASAPLPESTKPGKLVASEELPLSERTALMPPDLKKYCVPYCRAVLRSTSAMVASMRTSTGALSMRSSMALMRWSSAAVA